MTAQIETFFRNRFDQSSAQAEFRTDNYFKYSPNMRRKDVLEICSSSERLPDFCGL